MGCYSFIHSLYLRDATSESKPLEELVEGECSDKWPDCAGTVREAKRQSYDH